MSALYPILGTILATVLAGVFGIISYRSQKDTDRAIELRNQRAKGYEDYLTAYHTWVRWTDAAAAKDATSARDEMAKAYAAYASDEVAKHREKANFEYWLAYSHLFQIAADPVLEAVSEFHQFEWMGKTSLTGDDWNERFYELYAAMVFEIRKDVFEETKLPKDLIQERLPFSFPKGTVQTRIKS
jgi:hypothetical protein